MAAIFLITTSTRLRNDLHAFKVNSSSILFHSSSLAVLSQLIFGWDVVFVCFLKRTIKRNQGDKGLGLMEAIKKLLSFRNFFALVSASNKLYILCRFFSCSLILGLILMKRCLNKRANYENLWFITSFIPESQLIKLKRCFKNHSIFWFRTLYICKLIVCSWHF